MSWDLKEKNKIRKQVCKGAKPYKCVLMMPGDSCLDLKLMVKQGSIGLNTQVVVVERDNRTAKKIKSTLMELGRPKHVILQKELHEVEFPSDYKFDFVYLDTCGQLNEHVLNWLCKQVQWGIFEEGARISVAFSQWFRAGAKFYNNLSNFLKKEKISLARVINADDEITEFQAETHKVMGTTLRSIFGDIEGTWLYKNSSKGIPMHVFLFKGRSGNRGLGAIVKFLATYTDYEPEVLTPGLKAAVQRYKLTKKPRKTRGQAVKPNCADKPCTINKDYSIKRLEIIIKEMDRHLKAASKSIKSLNGRVVFLENKLKSYEEPVMIKNVTSNASVKVVETASDCNIAPMATDEKVDLALACLWGSEWMPI